MSVSEEIDKLCSRHIAKCLTNLETDGLTKSQVGYIKKQFRFLVDDIKHVNQKESKLNYGQSTRVD